MEAKWERQEAGSFWKPEKKGEEITGEVVKQEDGEFGTCFTIKQADGTTIATPSHKALLNRMANVRVGDEVKIVYLGEDLPKQKGYKGTRLYDVFIKKA